MMDVTLNELITRNKAAQKHPISSDLIALTPKSQQEKLQTRNVPSKNPSTHFSPGLSCAVSVGEKRQRNECDVEICNNTENQGIEQNNTRVSSDNGDADMGEELVQPSTAECGGLKFNDFDKLREEANFEVGQTWALYDTVADGMPRLYAQIRKVVSAPSFGMRITCLEPDPKDEKEIQWFEQDLPVSSGKFRLGKNDNTKDRSKFSHLIQCSESSNTRQLTVSPRKGETWALFKNWDIKWSAEPESHRKYEYEFVEVLSDYSNGAGVFAAYLHKAKGFASVFFRMGTGEADIFRIPPHSLYRFSHSVSSFKLTETEEKGLPEDAYELDQAALPETIEEIIVPSNTESNREPKRQAIYFASEGKVFQIGQIWSFNSGLDDLALYYGKIQKIAFTQSFKQEAQIKLHISRLKHTRFPEDVITWRYGGMPVGCGTFYARKVTEIISSCKVSHQVIPEISLDGIQYTILPKIGQVWVIYRYWSEYIDVEDLEYGLYDIVEILDDTMDYEVLLLKPESVHDDDDRYSSDRYFTGATEYTYFEDGGTEPIFTIPKSERIRFSNQLPALRVTKEIYGELTELFRIEFNAVPINVMHN